LAGILSYYTKRRVNLFLLPVYHLCYALRVAFSIRASKCEAVLVLDFLQVASVIKLLNPSATVCLQMHCEWLTQYATTASERRLRAVDLIFGCSDYITERIRKRFPAIATRCHTVHNGVDTDFFCPSPTEPATMRDMTEDLLYVGRMSPEKGVHVLIQAFKILAENRPWLRLHLVGPASMLPYLTLCPDRNDAAIASLEAFYGNRLSEIVSRQISRKNNSYLDYLAALAAADQRIIFHGAVSHHGTIDFYRRAAMLIFPSVGNETFGVPPIEAMACGLPVVSTYAGGIPEIVV
jgi:glycosyltransferase involved in cell wall biosynthesis